MLRLSNRAEGDFKTSQDLAREYIDDFLVNPEILSSESLFYTDVLYPMYLTEKQDSQLRELSSKLNVSVGVLFRSAISKGLGVP